MQESNIGRVIRWDEVEHGMLVRSNPGTGLVWHYVKLGEHGFCVGCQGRSGSNWGYMTGSSLPLWETWSPAAMPVMVIAEGMSGTEDGVAMRALAQAYDARVSAQVDAFEARQGDLALKLMCL